MVDVSGVFVVAAMGDCTRYAIKKGTYVTLTTPAYVPALPQRRFAGWHLDSAPGTLGGVPADETDPDSPVQLLLSMTEDHEVAVSYEDGQRVRLDVQGDGMLACEPSVLLDGQDGVQVCGGAYTDSEFVVTGTHEPKRPRRASMSMV